MALIRIMECPTHETHIFRTKAKLIFKFTFSGEECRFCVKIEIKELCVSIKHNLSRDKPIMCLVSVAYSTFTVAIDQNLLGP